MPSFLSRTQQTVVKQIETRPYVGMENLKEVPNGWLYDIKRWGSPFDLKLPTLPRLGNPSSQGISESEYFKSGVGSVDLNDLIIDKILETNLNKKTLWAPVINPGFYFRHKTQFYCYSDKSVVEYINRTNNINNRNYIELTSIPDLSSPILAASFRRDTETKYVDYRDKFSQRYSFSGTYNSSYEEQETVSDLGRIYWENVDFTKKEFIVDQTIDGLTRLWFNRDYNKTIGIVPGSVSDLSFCENIGISNGSGHEVLFGEDITLFTQVYALKYFPVLRDSSFHLYVSNGTSFTEWTLVDNFWDLTEDSEEKYFVDKDLGFVVFASISPANLPGQGNILYVSYDLTLRIEYEEKVELDKKIVARSANVNPITQSVNQGFVCLSHETLEPASITLSINKPVISGTSNPVLYGPITVGSDYAVLKANVKSVSGINLPNIQVFFTLEPPDVGSLNGNSISTSITNSEGNAFTNYQPPNNSDSLGFYTTFARDCTNPLYSGYREVVVFTDQTSLIGEEDSIYTYLIYKDDVILGYKTISDYLDSLTPPSWVVDSETTELWKNEMTLKYDLRDFVEPTSPNQVINGRKVVLYQINGSDNVDAYAINPVTGELGAVVPVRPILAEQITDLGDGTDGMIRLIYPANSIPNVGSTQTVGGIWIVSSKSVRFQAYCWSGYYNSYIYSNIINAKVSLPEYMLGEYINQLSQKIPFGWKLPSENDNVASGLNGATFITINPYSGPYEILDLVNSTGSTEEWASAPFRSLNIEFEII